MVKSDYSLSNLQFQSEFNDPSVFCQPKPMQPPSPEYRLGSYPIPPNMYYNQEQTMNR